MPKAVDTYSALHSNGCARAQMKDNLGKLGVGDCAIIPRMIVSASSTTTSSPPTFEGRSKSLSYRHVHDPRPADCPFSSSTPWPALSRNELRNILTGEARDKFSVGVGIRWSSVAPGIALEKVMVAASKLVKVFGVGDPDRVPCTVLIMTWNIEVASCENFSLSHPER